jgi:hypothetical protein
LPNRVNRNWGIATPEEFPWGSPIPPQYDSLYLPQYHLPEPQGRDVRKEKIYAIMIAKTIAGHIIT